MELFSMAQLDYKLRFHYKIMHNAYYQEQKEIL